MKFRFRTLIDQYHKLLYSQAVHFLGDPSEAEDVTQEAYERLWHNIEAVSDDRAKGWLLHVSRNLCIDKLRQRRASVVFDTELHGEVENLQPSTLLASSQISDRLRQLIDQLKEPYKSLIILAGLQQKTIKEVAQTMCMTENQVKVYIHRGRRQLRDKLRETQL